MAPQCKCGCVEADEGRAEVERDRLRHRYLDRKPPEPDEAKVPWDVKAFAVWADYPPNERSRA